MMLRPFALAALVLAAAPVVAQEPAATPAPAAVDVSINELINKIGTANDFTATWELSGGGRSANGTIWWQRPGRLRVETGTLQLISDGNNCVLIMHDSKSYLGGPVDWPVAGGGVRSGEMPFFAAPMLQPHSVLDLLAGVKASNAAFTVEPTGLLAVQPPTKEGDGETRVRYSNIKIDAPPAEGWFDTTGPAEYRNVTGLAAKPSFRAMDMVDKQAPPLGGIPYAGERKSLADLRGNVVVVDFWASWCAPCVQSLPEYADIARSLAKEGVIFVGVNTDERATLDQARALAREKKVDYPNVYGGNELVSRNWQIQTLPTLFVVRPDGVIHYAHVGLLTEDVNLRDLIAEARKVTPAGPQLIPIMPDAPSHP